VELLHRQFKLLLNSKRPWLPNKLKWLKQERYSLVLI
jgi:hypothetical protein